MNAIRPLAGNIPAELRSLPQWVTWAYEPRAEGQAVTKIPYNPATLRRAKPNDPATWGTFDAVLSAYSARPQRWAGVGFEFATDGGLVGVDLDSCRNPESGEIAPWAIEIIELFHTYAEISPSGTGIKLWARGSVPGNGTGKKRPYQTGEVEIYGRLRFFAMTGHRLPSAPATVNDAKEAINWLWGTVFAKPTADRKAKQASHPQNAAMNTSSRKLDYSAAERQIMERIDVRQEAIAAGVIFAGDVPAASWAPCHAIGRDDDTPSASICLDPGEHYGRYKDHASGEKAISFFELIGRIRGTDFRSVRQDYASKTGVPLPSKNGKAKSHWLDKIKVNENAAVAWGNLLLWACHKPPIDADTAIRAGARACKACAASCIVFRAYTPANWSDPIGVVLYRLDGQDFPAYTPKGLGQRKTHVYGHDGLVIVGTVDELQAAHSVLKCEGITDALAVAPHLPPGWIAVANICGAGSFPRELAAAFVGKRLFVAGDADTAGGEGSWRVVALSLDVAGEVRRLELPYPVVDDHGQDLRDFVAEFGQAGVGELISRAEAAGPLAVDDVPAEIAAGLATANAAATNPPASGDDRPTVDVTPDEHLVNDAAVAALAKDSTIFHRGGQLVRVVFSDGKPSGGITRPIGAPRIGSLPLATLRERLSACVRFMKWVGGDDGHFKPAHVPDFVSRAVASRGEWPGLRGLVAVVDAPTLRPDGTILDVPGWDDVTGLLYRPNADFPSIPPRPTIDNARQARDDLLAVVSDFPFAKAEHKAAWLAFMLTPLARHAFDGPAPLFLVDANAPGSGKSMACDLVSLIVTGRPMPRMANPADDAEASKLITSIALAGDTMVMIDNVAGNFGCPSLDAALTSTVWKGRILSKNETVELPLAPTWCASGNNVMLVGDIGRRICHIRLESDLPNPEERQGFAHPNLKAWVAGDRPRLIAAALTILRAFCVAGRAAQSLTAWGSFEGWSDLVRQAVAWVGMEDPGATRRGLENQSAGDKTVLRQLLLGWMELDRERTGMKAADAIRFLEARETEWHAAGCIGVPQYDVLRTAVVELCHSRSGNMPGPSSLGHRLRRLKGRRIEDDDRVLWLDSVDDHGTALWFVAEKKSESQSIQKNNSDANLPVERPPEVVVGGDGCFSCFDSNYQEDDFSESENKDTERIGWQGLETSQLKQPSQPDTGELAAEHPSPTPAPAAADRPPPAATWADIDPETAAAAEFVLELEAGDLPHGFEFKAGRLTDADKFLARLRADIHDGPRGPRNRYGALASDLRLLHSMLAGDGMQTETP